MKDEKDKPVSLCVGFGKSSGAIAFAWRHLLSFLGQCQKGEKEIIQCCR